MPLARTEAIVLRTIDWSETSLIAWLFTRERGRLHVLAKGARRPRSPFEGALEPLVRGELVSYQRKKAGDGLEIAKELDPLDRHTGLRKDLQRLYRGLYLGELLLELSEREMPAHETFDAAAATLAALCREEPGQLDRPLFRCELLFLRAAGLSPRLDACARCGAALPAGAEPVFSPPAGGLLCPTHAPHERGALALSRGALRTLLALDQGVDVRLSPESGRELRGLLDAFFTWYLERPLRTAATLRELAVVAAAPRHPEPAAAPRHSAGPRAR